MRRALLMVTFIFLPLIPLAGATQPAQSSTTHSPHGNLKIACVNCHTFTSWKLLRNVMEFDHNATKFPLQGLHKGVACTACHVSLVFTKAGTQCANCHADIHRGQFGSDCERCHTVRGWQEGLRDLRSHQNRFPLIGAHAALACDDCHKNAAASQFQGLSTDCMACHAQAFAQTTNPNHQSAGFPTNCGACHNMNTWQGAKFDHSLTGFPLTGAHATLDCSACHAGGNFKLVSATCVTCHLKDYNATTNPNHVQAGFPTDCSICHSTASWLGARFDHSLTGFPLTGAHATLSCESCHVGGNYTGLSASCISCHLKDYKSTTNPNHQAAGFPQQCEVCHTTTAWTPASFNHNLTGFPLTGAHQTVPCTSCHIGGQYAGTPADCYSCHKSDYLSTTDPNHAAANFPTDCSICHTTTSWLGATFNHTWFPIYSGTHAGRWNTCADCHVNPANYAVFSCITCHTHDQANTDPQHSGVRGYVYNGTSCYSCHPTGRAG
jgi:hypothetical protein